MTTVLITNPTSVSISKYHNWCMSSYIYHRANFLFAVTVFIISLYWFDGPVLIDRAYQIIPTSVKNMILYEYEYEYDTSTIFMTAVLVTLMTAVLITNPTPVSISSITTDVYPLTFIIVLTSFLLWRYLSFHYIDSMVQYWWTVPAYQIIPTSVKNMI